MIGRLPTSCRFLLLAVGVLLAAGGGAQAQARSFWNLPDARMEFIRQCTAHMAGRWAHPVAVCGCLHDHAAAAVQDSDLREALLRGMRERGVPTIDAEWIPPAKQAQISATFSQIAKPALQCMFDPAEQAVGHRTDLQR
ncbi:hypothetical protein [Rhodopseudomonas infernalis]|uniref:hypothetical protein n=1 Tax=Rhodopseudomonas infernalis TaxID=2897386 RepID=UPI00201BD8C6